MSRPSHPRAAALCFMGSGLVFLGVAIATGLYAFLGVGLGMLGIGVPLLATSRRQGR